ncbi:uncharacterized protein LOC135486846 [Lineus longissimus]|uniref:uncharacterized protein LOC135486846 n=1 Tax=Lineus longissimus TaxID=88925 RepID=UPI00315DAA3E
MESPTDSSIPETNRFRPDDQPPAHLQPLITIVVLIAGVVGGLVLVISVILFCKYCFKRKKVLKRQPVVCTRSSPDRAYRPIKKYESIDSVSEVQNLFSNEERSSSDQDIDSGSEVQNLFSNEERSSSDQEASDRCDHEEEDNIDLHVKRYQESLKGEPSIDVPSLCSYQQQGEPEAEPACPSERSSQGRRVSFHVETERPLLDLPGDHFSVYFKKGKSFDAADPRKRSTRRKSSIRYAEGDYHHLKKLKIERPPGGAQLIRQLSVGMPGTLPIDRGDRVYTRALTDDPSLHDGYYDVHVDQTTPMLPIDKDLQETPSPVLKSTKTEVRAEIHYTSNSNSSIDSRASKVSKISKSRSRSSMDERQRKPSPPTHLDVRPVNVNRHSHSMETVSPLDKDVISRRVKSYEGDLHGNDYDSLNFQQFHKGPFYNADYDVVSEGGGSPNFRSKVRYNDTGSLEEINSDAAAEMLDEIIVDSLTSMTSIDGTTDDTETLNGAQKYRDLWNLRATFEEEESEEFSDTIRMDDATSPDQSPDHEQGMTSHTTSFESNTEPVVYMDNELLLVGEQIGSKIEHLLHPNYENRRQTYKSILSKRLKKIDVTCKASAENSFDSVETMDTDGDVSDTSRPVDTTTSFESTTDNTDSTGDSQTHKLQQMKADSGYKSLESTAGQAPKLSKKQIHFALDDQESVENEDEDGHSTDKSPMEGCSVIAMGIDSPAKRFKNGRTGRTASKKRREYSRERQIVQIYESINEPESDRSELPSGDSFDENSAPSKMSVFSRFFKSQSRERQRQLSRDFSIDEKTDAIFNEFLRPDASIGQKHTLAVRARSPRLRPRLQRKHTEPMELYEYRRNKLVPEMRSASLGSDSSVASSRRLSPQDSIEEEYISLVKDWDSPHGDVNPVLRSEPVLEPAASFRERSPSTIRKIPIIQLPEEELATTEV